jgi:tetratricopeptide (TPR) repeat protein
MADTADTKKAYVEDVSDDESATAKPVANASAPILPIDGVIPAGLSPPAPTEEELRAAQEAKEKALTNFTLDDIPEKLKEAEKFSQVQDYESALFILGHAMKLSTKAYGELAVEMAPLYREYGLVLFETGRCSAAEFNGTDEQPAEEEQVAPEPAASASAPAAAEGAASTDAVATDAPATAPADATATGAGGGTDAGAAESTTEAAGDSAAGSDAGAADPSMEIAGRNDLELSRENLEMGRLILEAHLRRVRGEPLVAEPDLSTRMRGAEGLVVGDLAAAAADADAPVTAVLPSGAIVPEPFTDAMRSKTVEQIESYLAEAYETLGVTAMELEAWDESLEHLNKSLALRAGWGHADARGLASSHNQLMAYYAHQLQPQKASEHAECAANIFVARALKAARKVLEADSTAEGFAAESALSAAVVALEYVVPTEPSVEALRAPPAVGTKVLEAIEKALNTTSAGLRQTTLFKSTVEQLKDYISVRAELLERWDTLQDEIKAGVTDATGGKEIKSMVHEAMGVDAKTAGAAGAGAGAAVPSTFSSAPAATASAQAAVLVPVSKKKRPAPTPAPAAPAAGEASAAAAAAAAPVAARAADAVAADAAADVDQESKRARPAGETGAAPSAAAAAVAAE